MGTGLYPVPPAVCTPIAPATADELYAAVPPVPVPDATPVWNEDEEDALPDPAVSVFMVQDTTVETLVAALPVRAAPASFTLWSACDSAQLNELAAL